MTWIGLLIFPQIVPAATILFLNLRGRNYSREEIIQRRKLLILKCIMLFIYNWNWLKISQWRKKNIDWLSKFEKKSTNWHFLISGWLFGKILLSCKLHKPCDHSEQIYSTSVRSNEKYKDVALQNCSSKNSSSHFEVIFSIRAYVRAKAIIY